MIVLRAQVSLCVWEKVMRTKRYQVVFAYLYMITISCYLFIVEVVSFSKSDMQRMISVLAHQLVQVLTNVIHF